MTDHQRTLVAGLVAVGSVVLALGGLLVTRYLGVVGWALLVLGGAGVIDAVLIGLGVRTFDSQSGDQKRRGG
jgi:hypothetical protein